LRNELPELVTNRHNSQGGTNKTAAIKLSPCSRLPLGEWLVE